MKRVLTAAVLIPVVLTLLFKAPNWLYSGVIGVFAVIAIVEYFGIAKNYQPYHFGYVIVVAVGLYFLGHSLHDVVAFGVSDFGNRFESLVLDLSGFRVLPLLLLLLGLLFKDLRQALPAAAISYFGFLYIAVTMGEISFVGHTTNGRVLVFVLLVAVWSGDIFAYYAGRAFGKHKLAETISPKKTWEGAIASVVGAVMVTVLVFENIHHIGNVLARLNSFPSQSALYADARLYPPPWWLAAIFGFCVNVAAQLGDLVESALKRGAGVKDSGTILPGHGGMLDRIDALLFAAPVLWYFHFVLYKAIISKP